MLKKKPGLVKDQYRAAEGTRKGAKKKNGRKNEIFNRTFRGFHAAFMRYRIDWKPDAN